MLANLDVERSLYELDKADCEESLAAFVKQAWHVVEPGQEYVHGWHIDFVCAHLESIAHEEELEDGSIYNRLLINIPPGMSKSMLTGVFLPAWIWGPLGKPHKRIICASHTQDLAIRDGIRMRRLIESEWYQTRWGHLVQFTKDQNQKTKFENTALGFRQAVAAGSITGARADILILDDPNSVESASSDQMRASTNEWFCEAVPTRLNNPKKSAIVVIMQRLHECLLPGTAVRTPCGERPIETLAQGDRVYGSKGWQEIVATARREYEGTAYGVKLYGHPTVCWTTDNHEYLTSRGWVRADSLSKSDWIFLPAPECSNSTVEWEPPLYAPPPRATGTFTGARISVGAASVLDRFALEAYAAQGLSNSKIAEITGVHRNTVQCHMGHYGIRRVRDHNPIFTDAHLSDPDFWRLVGYWIAEGDFISGRGKSCGVRFTFGHTEQEYRDDVLDVAARYGMETTVGYPKSAISPQIHCSQLARWLERHFGKGAHNKRLPEFAFGLPVECQEQLLEGWFRGDGCERKSERGVVSVSRALIHDFQRLALRLGYNARVVPGYVGPKVNIIDGRVSVSSGRQREMRFVRTNDSRSKMRHADGGAWVKVRTIETKAYSGVVYDIETPSHDFVVGNATVHNCDVSGTILDKNLGYDHVCLPMRFEPHRSKPTMLGLEDPRTEEGELLFPERFPIEVVERDERAMGPYAVAGQFQQSPEPRGGGIIKRDWWVKWDKPQYPQFDYVMASLDTAYTTKAENDPSAMTVWGVWSGGDQIAQVTRRPRSDGEMQEIVDRQYREGHPKVMLMYAWAERLELHDLVERVRETMLRYGADNLLIENKAAGHSVAQELRRVYGGDDFGVQMYDPKTVDKMARLYSVQHLFADGLIHCPPKQWAESVINQCAQFPRAKHDDLVDTVSMSLKHLRDTGILLRHTEYTSELDHSRAHRGALPPPLYPV